MNNILLVKDPRLSFSVLNNQKKIREQYNLDISNYKKGCKLTGTELIIVDLKYIDESGLEILEKVCNSGNNLPVIVLTNVINEEDLTMLLRYPVHQCLIKSEITLRQIISSIYWTIGKNKEILRLKDQALTDELTGVYNRRGFFDCSKKKVKDSIKLNKSASLFFIDVNYLKQINDTYGHNEGDKVIRQTAEALKNTFRENDIVARLGGDEFVVLIDNNISEKTFNEITARLEKELAKVNEKNNFFYKISVSVGFARLSTLTECYAETLTKLLEKADENLYQAKKFKSFSEAYVIMEKCDSFQVA